MSDMKTIQEQLDESIPADCISDKKGLSYVSHRYVKNRLNEVFGFGGWSYRVISTQLLSLNDDSVRWFAHVRLEVTTQVILDKEEWPHREQVERDGLAVGHGTLKTAQGKPVSPGRANEIIDFAAAEAVTDALKRAAVSLGNSMGLELYPMGNKKKTGSVASRPAPKKKTTKKVVKF